MINKNKGIYIPDSNDLNKMESIIKNKDVSKDSLYKYCLAKKIECLINEGGLEFASLEDASDKEIIRYICLLYPEELAYVKNVDDLELMLHIIRSDKVKHKNGLDYLQSVSPELARVQTFISTVICELSNNLKRNPQYRFNYQPSKVLDDIFERKISINTVNELISIDSLLNIEPAYILDVYDFVYGTYADIKRSDALVKAIDNYTSHYGIGHFKDETCYEEEKGKKLVRFLNERR